MTEQSRQLPGKDQALAAMQHLQRLSDQRRQARPATEAEIDALDEALGKCTHCGGYHVRACPRVRKIEWHQNGMIASVEFWPAQDIDWSGVVFEDVDDEPGDAGPALFLDDVEADIHLIIDYWRKSFDRPLVGGEIENILKAMRRVELTIEEARSQAVQSDSEP